MEDAHSTSHQKDNSLYPRDDSAPSYLLSAISGLVAGLLETGILIFLASTLSYSPTMTPVMRLNALSILLLPFIFCMMPILFIAGALGGLIARNIVFILGKDIPSKRTLIVGGVLAGLVVPWLMVLYIWSRA